MGGKLRKYKILASAYLAISISAGSFGVYCAIPTTVANNGDSSEKILQLLETSVDDETDITENITTVDVPGNKVSFAQSSSDDVNPNTDGLFTWKDDSQAQPTPQPVQQPVSQPTNTSPTVQVEKQQPVADPFEMKDPFELDSSQQAKQESKQSKVTTQVKQESKQTQVSTQTKQESKQSKSTSTQVKQETKQSQASTQVKQETKQSQASTQVKQESKQSQAKPTQAATITTYKRPAEVTANTIKMLEEVGMIDKTFKTGNVPNLYKTVNFKSEALLLAKRDVMEKAKTIAKSPYYSASYDQEKNVIFIKLMDDYRNKPFSLSTIFEGLNWANVENFSDDTVSNFILDDTNDKVTVKSVDGYNGYLALILKKTYPVVIYNSPSIEPLVNSDMLTYIKENKSPLHTEVTTPVNEGTEISGSVSKVHGTPATSTPDITSEEDEGDTFYSDNDYDSAVDDLMSSVTGDETLNEINSEIANIKAELERKKQQNLRNKSTWGQTESDTKTFKDNISDGTDITSAKGTTLNVVDISGRQIDLKEATEKSKPAALKGYSTINVIQNLPETSIPISVYVCVILAILNLMLYTYYFNLFKKEYKLYLETRSVQGNVNIEDVGDYVVDDDTDVLDIDIISSDIILTEG